MAVRKESNREQEILQEHEARLTVLESLYRQLSGLSQDMKTRLDNHEEKITEQHLDIVKKEKELNYLVKYINGIQAIIRWSGSTIFIFLAGFFIWYIQHLPR